MFECLASTPAVKKFPHFWGFLTLPRVVKIKFMFSFIVSLIDDDLIKCPDLNKQKYEKRILFIVCM